MLIEMCTECLLVIGSALRPLGIEMEVPKVNELWQGDKTCTRITTIQEAVYRYVL